MAFVSAASIAKGTVGTDVSMERLRQTLAIVEGGAKVPNDDDIAFKAYWRSRQLATTQDEVDYLVVSAAYLSQWHENARRPVVPVEVASCQMLAFARFCTQQSPSALFVDDTCSAIRPDRQAEMGMAIYSLNSVKPEEFNLLIPECDGMLFPPMAAQDFERAEVVIQAQIAGRPLGGFEGRCVRAIDALDSVDGFDLLRPAMARVVFDERMLGSKPETADIAVRIASDMVVQLQARAILDEQRDPSNEDLAAMRRAAHHNPFIMRELKAQGEGRFSDLSFGSMLDIRSDILSGRVLPDSMTLFIRRNALAAEPKGNALPVNDNSFGTMGM